MGRFDWLGGLLALLWLGGMILAAAADRVVFLGSPAPSPEQLRTAAPAAWMKWRIVYAQLYRRLPQPPPEFGAVWTTRTGRVCGLVNARETAVNSMKRFYTVGSVPKLRTDDEHQYYRLWIDCADTRWVILHRGRSDEGFCASALGRASWLGRGLCRP
jgi:hypothetical protein